MTDPPTDPARAPEPRDPRPVRLQSRIQRAVANRRAFPYLAGATLLLAVGAGTLATIVDGKDFPTIGDGIWWAIVTLATVGYGDIVPTTTWGRVLGGAVIILGVTFLSFLTATVTSMFLADEQERREARAAEDDHARADATQAALLLIEKRLEAIEDRLRRLDDG